MRKTFKVPVLNQWWQTETGSAITATCVGFAQNLQTPPFTTGLPYCGYDIYVLDKNGHEAKPNELGRIVVKLPLPPGNMATLYRSDELFRKTYFQRFPVRCLSLSHSLYLSLSLSVIISHFFRISDASRATTTRWTPGTRTRMGTST